jgi:hypothetical protein
MENRKCKNKILPVLHPFCRILDKLLWIPSRKYDQEANSVAREYDAWERVSAPLHCTTIYSFA